MKKILLIILIAVSAISCSKDDETKQNSNIDPIIGTWHPVKRVQYPSEAEVIIDNYSQCEQQSTAIFHPNGNLETVDYYVSQNGDCLVIENNNLTSEWEKISDGIYRITHEELNSDGEVQYDVFNPQLITFPDNNTMEIKVEGDGYEGDEYDILYVITTYKKE